MSSRIRNSLSQQLVSATRLSHPHPQLQVQAGLNIQYNCLSHFSLNFISLTCLRNSSIVLMEHLFSQSLKQRMDWPHPLISSAYRILNKYVMCCQKSMPVCFMPLRAHRQSKYPKRWQHHFHKPDQLSGSCRYGGY